MKICLVGPQNVGKSSLFNALTTTHVDVVNYPGSTVQYSKAPVKSSYKLDAELTDTPGLHSLHSESPEQKLAVDYLYEEGNELDLIVAVVDSCHLAKQLYLISQLKDAGFPMILCITMMDQLKADAKDIDSKKLSEEFGLPVVCVCNTTQSGYDELISMMSSQKKSDGSINRPDPLSEKEIENRFADHILLESQVVIKDCNSSEKSTAKDPDSILLHPVYGGFFFIGIMFVIFTSIYSWAGPFMDLIDGLFGTLAALTTDYIGKIGFLPSWFAGMCGDGIVAGIGSVVIFLPQIVILFLFMSVLENSGYLARAAMLIDRPLSKIGLNGRSFVPMLSGFACAIPAMMAARTISNPKERFLTIFIIPLMSCSARLPVYLLLIGLLIPAETPYIGGLIMCGIYFSSILIGTIVATIISRMPSFKNRRSNFQMELPDYHIPKDFNAAWLMLKTVLWTTYQRAWEYLKKAGPVIILISLIIWLGTNFPLQHGEDDYDIGQSYAGKIGKVFEPTTEPMGLDWRGGVGILTSFAAREVFVSTLAILYQADDEDEDKQAANLLAGLPNATFAGTQNKIFTTSTICGLIFFFMVALQCFPTTVVAKKEMNSWKIALVQLVLYCSVAYIGAIVIVQGLRLFGIA